MSTIKALKENLNGINKQIESLPEEIRKEVLGKCLEVFNEVFGDSESNSLQVAYGQKAYDAYKCEVRNSIESVFGIDDLHCTRGTVDLDSLGWLEDEACDEIEGIEDGLDELGDMPVTLEEIQELSDLAVRARLVAFASDEFKRKVTEVFGVEV